MRWFRALRALVTGWAPYRDRVAYSHDGLIYLNPIHRAHVLDSPEIIWDPYVPVWRRPSRWESVRYELNGGKK